MNNIEKIIEYTNNRLNDWYKNSKIDHNITGAGIVGYHEKHDRFQIIYTENGITGWFNLYNYKDEPIDYLFNVWMEEANLEKDNKFLMDLIEKMPN